MITNFRKLKKRKIREGIFFPILLGFLFLIVMGFLALTNLKINQKRSELQIEIEALKKEIQILEEKNIQFRADISQVEKESHWEEKVRARGYIREGEKPVVILPPEEKEIKKEEKPNLLAPQTWWQWLKSKIGR